MKAKRKNPHIGGGFDDFLKGASPSDEKVQGVAGRIGAANEDQSRRRAPAAQ